MMLYGCNPDPVAGTGSQVIARVNNQDITIHELNTELGLPYNYREDDNAESVNQVLQSFIDRKLLTQQALKQALDRTPDTMIAMGLAREQALAQAYADRLGYSLQEPADADVRAYYDANPLLFKYRRYYQVRQLVIDLNPDSADVKMEELEEQLVSVNTIFDLIKWLELNKIPYQMAFIDKAAEKFSEQILGVLTGMRPGQVSRVQAGRVVVVLFLMDTRPAAFDLQRAAPRIRDTLREIRRGELFESRLENLRRNAVIEYFWNEIEKSEAEEQR
ncbi:MAG: EpsD family peptidyl-prolyl cis-trans isomerase [Candidatus Thiodiazotropha sp. (ex Ustalcina ferruginea)]|nr:EpsD family peptidyl-prolyl cis-trans isomerase [Candidatus Thiodiazotropha sp. (ex Ustalcina ferruginea)]